MHGRRGFAVLLCGWSLVAPGAEPAGTLDFVPFDDVRVADEFWRPRLEVNRKITIPHNLARCEEVGIIDNFAKAGGLLEGDYVGLMNWDEFLYKAVEAASYSLQAHHDPQLDRRLDAIIAKIAAAQEEDGYLLTPRTIALKRGRDPKAPPRWSNLRGDLELYMCGHLYEAAVAHHRATGKRPLLDVAIKNANLVDRLFGPDKNTGVPGHEEIELALIRLYETTANERYWKLSKFFIDQRGNAKRHDLYGPFHQDHKPFVEQDEAVGQAPRATYLYSGAADIARITGDAAYVRSLDRLWTDVVSHKLYITGGIGSRHDNEGFGPAYELPNRTAYTEICAAISFPMWACRMFRLRADARYFDVIERTLYNNFLAGVSLTGDRYFYACPLESDGKYQFNLGWCPGGTEAPYREPSSTRKAWFPCACCPPNLARYMEQLPGLIYAVRPNEIFVNLFVASQTDVPLGNQHIRLTQETQYPWDGKVRITVGPMVPATFAISIRVPGWTRGEPVPNDLYRFLDGIAEPVTLAVNGQETPIELDNGYARLKRRWDAGDTIDLTLPMPIQWVIAHRNVQENRGRVALQRGPVVYCVEGIDNGGRVLNFVLPDDALLTAEYRADLLGGVVVIQGRVATPVGKTGMRDRPFLAIPYCVWSNRGPGEMAVWIKRMTN